MVRINAERLSSDEKKFLRHAITYTLDYFIPRRNRKDLNITVDIRPRNLKDPLERDYRGVVTHTNRKNFHIWIFDKLINVRGKSYKGKLSKVVSFLNHELVHVKQYFLKEVVELTDETYKYKGRVYRNPKGNGFMEYFEQPEEIEAYGREKGLDMRFWVHWDKYVKQRATRS